MVGQTARAIAILLFLSLLTACHRDRVREKTKSPPVAKQKQGQRYALAKDGGPAVPPDISRIPEPVPRAEPPAKYGNRSPYTVLGRTYRVLPSSEGYRNTGLASWYGNKFHGHLTSSREPYDMYQFTAAHKTLPLPTFVRVKNLENGRSVVVRVNDRGPFHESRIIDLSYVAAVKLGIHLKGVGQVEVSAIEAQPAESPVRAPAPREGRAQERLYLQVGAFDRKDNAQRLADRLEKAGMEKVYLDRERRGWLVVHRVRIGPLSGEARAQAKRRLERIGLSSIPVTQE